MSTYPHQLTSMPNSLNRDIHVWEIDLRQSREQIQELSECLNEQERQRAAKFINPTHGDRWTVARGFLRQILSNYINLTPERIVFSYGQQGKPSIAGNPIQFNLSHSHDRAVYAISAEHPVGIDIEYIQPIAAAQLVDRFFSTAEQAMFHALPLPLQQRAFFHAWTQKEAYLKACGTGLSTPLDQIQVSVDPHTPAQIIALPVAPSAMSRENNSRKHQAELELTLQPKWQIHKLKTSSDYAGAIVIGRDCNSIIYTN